MKKITLILADDHRLVRDGIKSLLSGVTDIAILAEAENGTQAIEFAKTHKPAVMLLDISMPQLGGLDAIKAIKSLSPDTKVIMLSMHEEPEYVIKSLKNGASGYLLKSVARDELLKAIHTVASGGVYYQSDVAQTVMQSFSPEPPKASPPKEERTPTLTEREKEILHCVAEGLSTKQIAKKLFISPRTVEVHRSNMIKKLGAQNAAELVKLALQYGLIA
ncbi:MAG: response regulator transcription factor [Chloroherpetonaceae bacterium]